MSVLIDLSKQCENAKWVNREIDAAIAVAIRYHPYGPSHWLKDSAFPLKPNIRKHPHDGHLIEAQGWILPFDQDGVTPLPGNGWNAPHYTSSVDAAMTLIPGGEEWSLHRVLYDNKGCPAAVVNLDLPEVLAATPALALASAALRARHAASCRKD